MSSPIHLSSSLSSVTESKIWFQPHNSPHNVLSPALNCQDNLYQSGGESPESLSGYSTGRKKNKEGGGGGLSIVHIMPPGLALTSLGRLDRHKVVKKQITLLLPNSHTTFCVYADNVWVGNSNTSTFTQCIESPHKGWNNSNNSPHPTYPEPYSASHLDWTKEQRGENGLFHLLEVGGEYWFVRWCYYIFVDVRILVSKQISIAVFNWVY